MLHPATPRRAAALVALAALTGAAAAMPATGSAAADRRHASNIRLVTDNQSGTADWRLHVKLIWHRSAPVPNVTKDVYLPFDESCAPQTGGGGGGGGIPLPAAPAGPSVGGG